MEDFANTAFDSASLECLRCLCVRDLDFVGLATCSSSVRAGQVRAGHAGRARRRGGVRRARDRAVSERRVALAWANVAVAHSQYAAQRFRFIAVVAEPPYSIAISSAQLYALHNLQQNKKRPGHPEHSTDTLRRHAGNSENPSSFRTEVRLGRAVRLAARREPRRTGQSQGPRHVLAHAG